MLSAMLRVAVPSALVMFFVFPLAASGQELMVQTVGDGRPLLRSGLEAVERLSASSETLGMAVQAQQTALNHDRKTTIIVIAVVAVVAVIYVTYKFHHLGPFITLH